MLLLTVLHIVGNSAEKVFTVDDISGDISEEGKCEGKGKEQVEKVKKYIHSSSLTWASLCDCLGGSSGTCWRGSSGRGRCSRR